MKIHYVYSVIFLNFVYLIIIFFYEYHFCIERHLKIVLDKLLNFNQTGSNISEKDILNQVLSIKLAVSIL